MPDEPILLCTSGALEGRRLEVPEGGLEIGRAQENGLVIRDDGVSRYHARILYDNGSLWIQDAGSRNGVFVNGVRVTGHRSLKVGDEISIAQHVFAVRWDETGDEDTVTRDDTDARERRAAKRRWFWPFS